MKKLTKSGLALLIIVFFASLAPAQERKKDKDRLLKALPTRSVDRDRPARDARPKRQDVRDVRRPADRDVRRRPATNLRPDAARGMMHQQQIKSLQTQIERRKQQFQRNAGELKAIKKIALQEGATKTAAYIDKLLEKKEKQMATELKGPEDRIKNIQAQIEKQAKQRQEQLKKARQKKTDKPTDKDKKDK